MGVTWQQGEWTGMHMCEQWQLHCTSLGAVHAIEWACVLCGSCIKNDWASSATNLHQNLHSSWTCFHRNYSSTETIQMIQKAAAIGNWLLAASSRQSTHSGITSHAEFFGETSNYPGDSVPLQPRFGTSDLWLFPKLKSPLKGERFQTISEIPENTLGKLMVIERTVWGPKVPTLKGTEVSLFYVQCPLYFVSSSINVSIFHITWLDTFCIYM